MPPTMLESLFTHLDVGQTFAAHHDAISDKTILRMAIENRRDTAEITGSAGFSANFHGITSDDASQPLSLTTASTSDISELVSAFSSAADAQTAQITALMAAMMDQRLTENKSNAPRNNPRKEGNQIGNRNEKPNSYCWLHGVTRNMDHNSGTRDNQHTGHQSEATLDNRMGGSDRTCGYLRNYSAPGPAN